MDLTGLRRITYSVMKSWEVALMELSEILHLSELRLVSDVLIFTSYSFIVSSSSYPANQ